MVFEPPQPVLLETHHQEISWNRKSVQRQKLPSGDALAGAVNDRWGFVVTLSASAPVRFFVASWQRQSCFQRSLGRECVIGFRLLFEFSLELRITLVVRHTLKLVRAFQILRN